jgi:hypothetical protein
LALFVTVGGKKYEIFFAPGQRPVWELLKRDGKPMSQAMFDRLPEDDKQILARLVQAYLDSLKMVDTRQT